MARKGLSSCHATYAALATLAVATIARGTYVMFVEHPERALVETPAYRRAIGVG